VNFLSTIMKSLANHFATERHEITRTAEGSPYLTRWTLLGQRFGGRNSAVFLHRFHRSDADEMHNHPWPFFSVILAGGYWEKTPAPGWKDGDGPTKLRWYGPGCVLRRPARWVHSVLIPEGQEAWTLIFRGPKEQSWGFYCPALGFRPWREHLAMAKSTGNGCGGMET
jgi:hypothetical protein